jgi:hypothetical protein
MIQKRNDLYDIIVNNKVICRNIKQAHIRGVIYGLWLDQIKYMSQEALRDLIIRTSEMIEEGVDNPSKSILLAEQRIRKFCLNLQRDELLQHVVDWFLKAEGYSLYLGK